jgi:hypothetical protein
MFGPIWQTSYMWAHLTDMVGVDPFVGRVWVGPNLQPRIRRTDNKAVHHGWPRFMNEHIIDKRGPVSSYSELIVKRDQN